MPAQITLSESHTVGTPVVFEAPSPETNYLVVFEDDGETGYLYGADPTNTEQPILDALHIYNVKDVVDRETASVVEILWSEDGLKACLVIDQYPHAVFDFEARRACCRNNFPPPDSGFTTTHEWDERALEPFS